MVPNDRRAQVQDVRSQRSGHAALTADPIGCDPSIAALIQELQGADHRQGQRVMERRVMTAAGERTFIVIRSPISPEGGMVVVCQDTTNERAISEMKNDFVSMVSHELRTPLASIKAYVEMLIDGEAQDEKTRSDFYDVIQNEANRLGRLIDNILNISRIESGVARTNMEAQTLDPILDDAIGVITPQAQEKKITIINRRSPVNYQTSIDREMLYQAVLNLLSNAIKYTEIGGKITVETSVDVVRKVVLTRIIDTGVGIPPKDVPYVFDKFYRAEANNRIAPGTGLGLARVRHIIETVHKGRVFVESQIGQGSCFGFELPTFTS